MRALDRDDPKEIGGYRLLRVLGAGGMGRVYLARSPGGRTVAVKVIRPELSDDPGFRSLFRREVAAAKRVGGAWTAPVLDADTEAPRPWLVTGYVAGPSVYEAVERHGPLPESAVRTLGAGLAEALIGIHGTGLIHRDLKPTNVLLSLDGPRVIDFGISRALDASVHTRTGATVGSPGFMSPEQIDGRDVGPATDIFSLASVLVFAATAEGPFGSGSGQALMFRIVSKSPELGAVPPSLRDLISACLAKYAANRPTPHELLAHFAPNGSTAALIAPGWLPGPLTTDMSRRAIALLEIDELAGDDVPSGVTSAADQWPSMATAPTQPPSQYAETRPPSHHRSSPQPPPMPRSAPNAVGHQAASPPRMPSVAPRAAAPPKPPPPAAPIGPAFPGPPPASAQTPAKTGTRRGTPWLYLSAVAGAIAIVSTSAIIARSGDAGTPDNTTPSNSRSQEAVPPQDGSTTPTATPTGNPSPPAPTGSGTPTGTAAAKIPTEYVGTWTGTITSQNGLATTAFTVKLHQADGQGIVAETTTNIPLLGVNCTSSSKLISADAAGVKLQDVGNNSPQPTAPGGGTACTNGGQITLRLDLAGNTVLCSITEAGSGNPQGTLRRS